MTHWKHCNSLYMQLLRSLSLCFVFLSLLAGCGTDLNEPVASANSAITTVDEPINQQGNDESSDLKTSAVENFTYSVQADQSSITLLWNNAQSYTHSVVRASNPDCLPLDENTCEDYNQSDLVTSPYIDSDVTSGSVYYYWVLSHPPNNVQQQSGSTLQPAPSAAVSNPVRIATEFTGDLFGIDLIETAPTSFLEGVSLVRHSETSVMFLWQSNPDIVATIYASIDENCDVLDATATCAETLVSEQSASSPSLELKLTHSLDDYFFWVYAKNYVPLTGSASQTARLYGPMHSDYQPKNTDGSVKPAITLQEKAHFTEHSLSVTFPAPTNLVQQFATYNFYVLSGSEPADKELIKVFMEANPVASMTELKHAVDQSKGNLHLFHKQVNFPSLRQLSTGQLFTELVDAETATWYTVILIAEENNQLFLYQPSIRKSLQHMKVNVRGKNGLWNVRDKTTQATLLAKKGSGMYYPSTRDWRNLMIDAQLAFPEKQAYYFTGCAYYKDKAELGDRQQLFDNQCHYAQVDTDSGKVNTVLSRPTTITVVFERKAQAKACQNYQKLPAHGYERSRNNRLGTYGQAICDHRLSTTDNSGNPHYFVMEYPHGEPTEIARSQVEQWYGGTQVPMYLGGTAPLPVVPDGIIKKTVCSDLGEGQECAFNAEITVVRCNGYYAYELAEPTGCSVGYAWEESPIAALHRNKEDTGE